MRLYVVLRDNFRQKSEEVDLEILAKNSVGYARKALEEKAAEYQCNLRDMACTIIAIVCIKILLQ